MKFYCDRCGKEHDKQPKNCGSCGCPEFNWKHEMDDQIAIILEISELVELVNHIADGAEEGDNISEILVSATPQDVKDYIIDELDGCKA